MRGLRRVSEEKVLLAQLTDTRRRLSEKLVCPKVGRNARLHALLQASDAKLHELGERWAAMKAEYAEKAGAQIDGAREALAEMRRELRQALRLLEHAHAAA